jgi:hypothetical protein
MMRGNFAEPQCTGGSIVPLDAGEFTRGEQLEFEVLPRGPPRSCPEASWTSAIRRSKRVMADFAVGDVWGIGRMKLAAIRFAGQLRDFVTGSRYSIRYRHHCLISHTV